MANNGSSDLWSVGSGWWRALSDTVTNSINLAEQKKWNEQQQKNWETQFEYTKWLNDQQMKREDTAVQRSVADHQAAGFNKLLAIGQPSQSGTLTSFTGNAGGSAPQMGDIKNPIEAYLEAMQMQKTMQLTEAQENLLREQATTEGSKRELNETLKALNSANMIKSKVDAVRVAKEVEAIMFNMRMAENTGTKVNENVRSNNLYSLLEKLAYVLFKQFGIDLYDITGNDKDREKELRESLNRNTGQGMGIQDLLKEYEKIKEEYK